MIYKHAQSFIELNQAYRILESLGQIYPDFHHWYWNKVVPGVALQNDKVILAYNKNEHDLIGISIIKDTLNEKKLRALRINPKYQKRGYGLHLIDESLIQLNCDKPLLSVSEDMMHDFSRIFVNKYQFDLTYVHKGIYSPGKLEYQFNGLERSLKETSLPF